MPTLKRSTTLFCALALGAAYANAADEWFTLVGDPSNPSADYIQFAPGSIARTNALTTIQVRVSRANQRTSKEGIVFKSFVGVAAVDCKKQSARFLQSSFYAEPAFAGTPFRTEVFAPNDVRPMAFREINGEPSQRVIRAACQSGTAAISTDKR